MSIFNQGKLICANYIYFLIYYLSIIFLFRFHICQNENYLINGVWFIVLWASFWFLIQILYFSFHLFFFFYISLDLRGYLCLITKYYFLCHFELGLKRLQCQLNYLFIIFICSYLI